MDLADDVAYSVHDVEDGVVAEPGRPDRRSTGRRCGTTVRAWYLPEADDDALDDGAGRAAEVGQLAGRAVRRQPRRSLAALKNLTSDLIGRFCGAAQEATFAPADGPFVRYRRRPGGPRADPRSRSRCSRAIAAHYVMQAEDRVALMIRQRELVAELVEALLDHAPASLERAFADDWRRRARRRRPAAGRDRPGRLAHRRQRGHLARAAGAAGQRGHGRLAVVTLVWLPFDPAELGDPPSSFYLRGGRPDRVRARRRSVGRRGLRDAVRRRAEGRRRDRRG